jgi:hypothetical protein
MYASVAPCTLISAVSGRDSPIQKRRVPPHPRGGRRWTGSRRHRPSAGSRRRIMGGRAPASVRAPAAAPAAHLPAGLHHYRNLCAPAGGGAMVPPPPRPSHAYRRRPLPPPHPPWSPSHPPPRPPPPPPHPGAAKALPAAAAAPPGRRRRPAHR